MRPVEPEDESEVGSKILPNPQLHIANLTKYKREDYKHWKPWNKDKNLPKWAETLTENADLKTVLTKDSKEGEKALKE